MIPNLKNKLNLMRKETPTARPEPAASPAAARCRRIRRVYPYGAAVSAMQRWEKLPVEALSLLMREEIPKGTTFRDLCFLDTETTGLSTGAGTVAFLIGLAYFEEDGLTVEQFFLEDLHQEEDAMKICQEKLTQYSAIVTYNGKNYDLPLLETRALMNRMRLKIPRTSLDLLYPARRFYKGRYESCSLGILEEEVLGIVREEGEDIPGAQIPAAYFQYLQTRDETQMQQVISHNRQDLVSLAELMLHMACVQETAAECGDAGLVLACARNALEAGKNGEAEKLLLKASESSSEAAEELIWFYKRQGRFEDAYAVCLAWTKGHTGGLGIWELKAKLEEHYYKDYKAALESCRRALRILPKSGQIEVWDAWHHRRERLLRRDAAKERT